MKRKLKYLVSDIVLIASFQIVLVSYGVMYTDWQYWVSVLLFFVNGLVSYKDGLGRGVDIGESVRRMYK